MARLYRSEMTKALKIFVRDQMRTADMSYGDLSRTLMSLGVDQSESNLRSKINNGKFSAQFFVFVLIALGTEQLNLDTFSQAIGLHLAQSEPNYDQYQLDES